MKEHEPHSSDERAIVRQARAGDEAAYTEIYQSYHRRLYWYMAQRTDQHTAEDLTQITLMKVLTSLPKYRETDTNFEAWVMTIARNVAVDYFRQQGRSREEVELDMLSDEAQEELAVNQPTTEQRALARIAFQRVLASLTPQEREVLPVAIGEIKSHEFGELKGESSGASRKRLHTLRVKLHDKFGSSEDIA